MLNLLDWGSRVYPVLIVAALTLLFLVLRAASPARRQLGNALLAAPVALFYFLEHRLGIFREPWTQAQVAGRGMRIDLANWMHLGAHLSATAQRMTSDRGHA